MESSRQRMFESGQRGRSRDGPPRLIGFYFHFYLNYFFLCVDCGMEGVVGPTGHSLAHMSENCGHLVGRLSCAADSSNLFPTFFFLFLFLSILFLEENFYRN
jgi:hypothetical protein